MINEVEKSEIMNLKESVDYSEGSIVSKLILKKDAGNITLFAFDKGQSLSEHTAPYDAFTEVLDGKGIIVIDGKANKLSEGDAIIMPANVPHAVIAEERFKMMLTMLKSSH